MNLPYPRSDAQGSAVPNLDDVLLSTSFRYQDTDATYVRDFKTITWTIQVKNKSTATKITAQALWSSTGTSPILPTSPTALGDFGVQVAEEIASGVATEDDYTAEYDISGKTAPFDLIFTLPVAGPHAVLAIKADVGTPQVYTRVWRGN